ncbi:YoaK family protein [Nocardioides kribbensis]|uniref:YoaK family protein n=1 Tax=Nocardioides kribbensis TaxID=305517 RepID=UPI0029D413C5|nr:YoaK family protein [Nocardioides kribbensis]
MTSRLAAVSHERMHLVLMLVLTFTTGIVDAVGYLGLDRVFTGNMTGNVVILGMAIVGADDLPVLGPVVALVGFMAGAALGGRVLRRAGGAWTRRTTLLFTAVAVVCVGLGVLLLALGETPGETPAEAVALPVTAALGAAMGVQAATARFIAVKDVTTVVVTSTITGLAADSVLGSGKGGGSGRRVLAVALILLGAAAGAALLRWHLGAGLVVAGGLVALATLLGAVHARLAARVAPSTLA